MFAQPIVELTHFTQDLIEMPTAEKLDEKEVVTFKELLMAQMIHLDTV